MLFRYSEFNSTLKINENIAGAKKILKDTFVLNKAVKELSPTKTDPSGMFLLDKDGVSINFDDLPEEIKGEARKKVREIKLSEDELRQVERHPKFQEIREFLGDKLGFSQIFTYLYFKEKVEISELKELFADGKYGIMLGNFDNYYIENYNKIYDTDVDKTYYDVDVKIEAPYKTMIYNSIQFDDMYYPENSGDPCYIYFRWIFVKTDNKYMIDGCYLLPKK